MKKIQQRPVKECKSGVRNVRNGSGDQWDFRQDITYDERKPAEYD